MKTGLNDLNDIPKAWRNALASVQVTFPDAVIAGGCLRDREAGVKVKDIDIFISTTHLTPSYGVGNVVSRLTRDGWVEPTLNHEESYAGKRGIVAVVDLKYPGAPEIQLIAMKQFKLEEFDFGICQIMFDGKRIIRLPDYHHDKAARQFRIIPKLPDNEIVRSLGRWARLKEKFPGWTLHLGSRAETPFVPPRRMLDMTTVRPSGPAISMLKGTTDGLHPAFSSGGYLRRDSIDIQLIRHSGEYILPKAVAERLAKETTAQALKTVGNNVLVRIDDRAVDPACKIMESMQASIKASMQAKYDQTILGNLP